MRILLTSLLLVAAFSVASSAAPGHHQLGTITHPSGATDVVLRVSSGGGFVAPQTNLRALPAFTLYGDGTVIVPGAVIQIYPGPAVYPLVRSKLNERQVQALLRRAKQVGLLARGAIDYGDMGAIGVADAPTTTLLVNAGGRHLKRQAYALGIATGGGRLSAEQISARRALARFIAKLPQGVSGAQYTPRAIAVYVGPFRGEAQPGAAPIVWPLKSDLATAGKRVSSGVDYRCISVSGEAAGTLLATLRKANEQSQWTARSNTNRTYQLIARPLLPDQRDCASAGA
jgi:hypothetical protein